MEPKTQGRIVAGGVAALAAVIALLVGKRDKPNEVVPVTTTATATASVPSSAVAPRQPLLSIAVPETAMVPTTESGGAITPAVVPLRRRAVTPPPNNCNAADMATAFRYGATPGYECLMTSCLNRDGTSELGCEIIHDWLATGGEVTEYIAARGFDSPLANCEHRRVIQNSNGSGEACLVYTYEGETFIGCDRLNPCVIGPQKITIWDFPCVFSLQPTLTGRDSSLAGTCP